MAISKITTSSINKPFGFKNLIINGAMTLAQRATSATTLAHATYKTIDRFSQNLTANSFVLTSEQSTDAPAGFDYSLKIACTTADTSLAAGDRMMFYTRVEDKDLGHLEFGTAGAKSLTLSFYVKSNKTGTYQVNLWHNNAGKFTSATYTIDSASTWERKTMTFHGDSSTLMGNDNAEGVQIEMVLLAGTNYTSGTINTSTTYASTSNTRAASQTVNIADNTSNTWQVTGMQLEVGTKASDFEVLPVDVNLQRCYRYFFKFKGSGNYMNFGMTATNGQNSLMFMSLPSVMRNTPTLSSSGTFSSNVPYGGAYENTTGGPSIGDFGGNLVRVVFTTSTSYSAGLNGRILVLNDGNAFIAFDAEL